MMRMGLLSGTPYEMVSAAERSDYPTLIACVPAQAWPKFMLNDPIANRYWDDLYERFPAFQFALIEAGTDIAVAIANSVPLAWEGDMADLPEEGWDWACGKRWTTTRPAGRPTCSARCRSRCCRSIEAKP